MKMVWLSVIVLAMGCLGCGRTPDNRIVDLEKRIATLEGRLAAMERQMFAQGMRISPRRAEDKESGDVSRRAPLSPEQIAERQRLREDVRKRLEERRDKARAKKQSGEGIKDSVKKPVAE